MVSSSTARAFQQSFGEEAADEMTNWMNGMESSRAELRQLSDLQIQRFREQTELQMQSFREQSELRTQRFNALLDARFDELHRVITTEMMTRFNDVLNWSFVFWVGSLWAIAALAGVLR